MLILSVSVFSWQKAACPWRQIGLCVSSFWTPFKQCFPCVIFQPSAFLHLGRLDGQSNGLQRAAGPFCIDARSWRQTVHSCFWGKCKRNIEKMSWMILRNGFASHFLNLYFGPFLACFSMWQQKVRKSLTSCQSFLVILFLAFI